MAPSNEKVEKECNDLKGNARWTHRLQVSTLRCGSEGLAQRNKVAAGLGKAAKPRFDEGAIQYQLFYAIAFFGSQMAERHTAAPDRNRAKRKLLGQCEVGDSAIGYAVQIQSRRRHQNRQLIRRALVDGRIDVLKGQSAKAYIDHLPQNFSPRPYGDNGTLDARIPFVFASIHL